MLISPEVFCCISLIITLLLTGGTAAAPVFSDVSLSVSTGCILPPCMIKKRLPPCKGRKSRGTTFIFPGIAAPGSCPHVCMGRQGNGCPAAALFCRAELQSDFTVCSAAALSANGPLSTGRSSGYYSSSMFFSYHNLCRASARSASFILTDLFRFVKPYCAFFSSFLGKSLSQLRHAYCTMLATLPASAT